MKSHSCLLHLFIFYFLFSDGEEKSILDNILEFSQEMMSYKLTETEIALFSAGVLINPSKSSLLLYS